MSVDEDWLDLKGLPERAYFVQCNPLSPAALWSMRVVGSSTGIYPTKGLIHLQREKVIWSEPGYRDIPPPARIELEPGVVAYTPEEIVRDMRAVKRAYLASARGKLLLLNREYDKLSPDPEVQVALAVFNDLTYSPPRAIAETQAILDFWQNLDPDQFISMPLET